MYGTWCKPEQVETCYWEGATHTVYGSIYVPTTTSLQDGKNAKSKMLEIFVGKLTLATVLASHADHSYTILA